MSLTGAPVASLTAKRARRDLADDVGVVTFGTGDQVAWFRDPDGNTLSVAEMSGKA